VRGACRAFFTGLIFHAKGVRLGMANRPFLKIAARPLYQAVRILFVAFCAIFIIVLVTSILFYGDFIGQPHLSSMFMKGFRFAMNIPVILLATILSMGLFFPSIFINEIAAYAYNHFPDMYRRQYAPTAKKDATGANPLAKWKAFLEEFKKGLVIISIPPALFLIPKIGLCLAFMVLISMLAWDYIDFSLSKDFPLLKDRIKLAWRYKFYLLGFGLPLGIPFVNMMLIPFAILGATKLYYDEISRLHA